MPFLGRLACLRLFSTGRRALKLCRLCRRHCLPRRMAMAARVMLVAALVVVWLRLLKHFLPNTYAVIKDWQTLVAGLVGFGGLAWVTYENAKLGRSREDRVHRQNINAEKVALDEKARAFAAVVAWQIAYSLLEVVTARKRLANLLESDETECAQKVRQILQTLRDIPPTPLFEPSSPFEHFAPSG